MVRKKGSSRYENAMCFVMLFVEFVLGFVQIYFYDIGHLLCITYLFIHCEEENIIEKGIVK